MLNRVLAATRYLMIIPVIGSFVGATALLVYGGAETLQLIQKTLAAGEVSRSGAKSLAIEFIEIIDLFLLGTVFYIIAFGLYELFIEADIGLPDWLEIRTLDDLKNKLVKVVIVVLGVLFLGHVVSWSGSDDVLYLGGGIAVVVAALTWFLKATASK